MAQAVVMVEATVVAATEGAMAVATVVVAMEVTMEAEGQVVVV